MLKTTLICCLFTAISLYSQESTKELKLQLQFDVQAKKKLSQNYDENMIDDMFGRMRVRLDYQTPEYESQMRFRFYPIGFGYNALGVTQSGNLADSTLKEIEIAKTQVYRAYLRSKDKTLNFTIGRFGVGGRYGKTFGSYLEGSRGTSFLGADKTVNGIELFMNDKKVYRSSLAMEINDSHFNSGNLRFETLFGLKIEEGLFGKIGWKANVYDQFYKQNENDLTHTVAGGVGYSFSKKTKLFLIAAAQNISKDHNEYFPVSLAYQVPVPYIADQFTLELEYDKEREIPLASSVHFAKLLDEYFHLDWGVYNTGKTSKYMENFEIGVRLSGYLLGKNGWIF